MSALQSVARWPVPNAAAVVVEGGRVVETYGDVERPFRVASITKMLAGWAAMIAVEEGVVALDDPAGQEGCTIRHLLAHAGGYGFNDRRPISAPGRRRIYSNTGIDIAGAAIGQAAGMGFDEYITRAVLEPLVMASSELRGSPAHALVASAADLARFVGELQAPALLSPAGACEVVSIQYPDLSGIVPGVGRFDPCPWGLGVEIRGHKFPHWMGSKNSPGTVGHFGGAGTMLWVDPDARRGLIALTDRRFDDWPGAVGEWSRLSDQVIAAG